MMKKILGVVFSMLALAVVVSPAHAGYNWPNGGTTIKVTNVCKTTVSQTNVSNMVNNIGIVTNTGGNKANNNTGGNVNVTTGSVTSTVTVTNVSGGNFAQVSGCCSSCSI